MASDREPLTPEQEVFACGYDPWGERDATYRTLADKFVTTRAQHKCGICFETIPAGSRVRSKREVDDGRVATFRFCVECCYLMAHRNDVVLDGQRDPFELLCERYDIGRKAAEVPDER